MGKRGGDLREHLLWAAVEVFLGTGFERASMDLVAAHAKASKRTLYTYFENKENLFLATIEAIREVFLENLGFPEDGPGEPVEAVTSFCGRYLRALRYEPAIQMCRVCISEAARFPLGATRHYDAVFGETRSRLARYLQTTFALPDEVAAASSERLLGTLLYPRLLRAVYGLDALERDTDFNASVPEESLGPIREEVRALLATLR